MSTVVEHECISYDSYDDLIVATTKALEELFSALEQQSAQSQKLKDEAVRLCKEFYRRFHAGLWSVDKGGLTVQDVKDSLKELGEKQRLEWVRLVEASRATRDEVEAMHQKIQSFEVCINHCSGKQGPNHSWFQIPTPDQARLRHAYSKGLRSQFKKARTDVDALVSYPNGLLTKVEILYKNTESERTNAIENLREKRPITLDGVGEPLLYSHPPSIPVVGHKYAFVKTVKSQS